MTHLENVFLKNVLLYLPTLKDVGRFAQVSKSCEEAINTIYVNPYELTIHHSFDEIIPLFPNLQTFYVRRCPSRLYKITANDIPLIEVGGWNEQSKQTQVFNTKWFCSKIRKIRIDGYYCKKVIEKHPNYFIQLQELVVMNGIDINALIQLFELPTLKKVIIICSIGEFQLLSKSFDFNKHNQINFIIIFIITYSNTNILNQMDYNQFINCRFYTRTINKSTMNCPYLPILPYESQFLIDNCDMTIESDVFNKINEINEIIVKNNLQNILIKNVLNDYEGNRIDLTPLSIESLSIQDVEKQNVDIIIPPHLKSLIINSCKASIDISKCHLKKIIISNYQGKVMDIYDDKLEVFQNNSNEEVTWYHNNTLLKKNEIYVDTNKITSFKTGYIYYFININNNNNYNNNNNASKTIIFKCNDKEIKINEVYEFSFENKHLYCSLGNIQELDFGEYTFDSFNVTSGKIKYLKVKCNSIILTNVECDNLVTDDVCKRFNLINCTINTLTCGIVEHLNSSNSQITTINANKVMCFVGPNTRINTTNRLTIEETVNK
ncbi:hypothetical protein CL6EHI_131460 [Entamoeba histolytica]|uniref:Uncharacterized protein n=3 Tax=Entamoeba histolytica TaxID=5759 RepID=C4M9Y1_ENTH1|nr:hypothetical protein EHI_131460 [Entamoeba histolytica HM-1:IMSS]EAL49524.2 hypothetical protein EHI_131460 [Entamoeba histolytica HM-1:IMSS]GAT98543.1 hypothetical protein CL6EHI_131460 [Entamoeba histolytica]|eukprot:XP_654910.2 hypothetical protein EHI_131460 [Entamoeba histolytica HM-1:IMSS]